MEAVNWSAPDGTKVWGNYYAPTNPNFKADGPPPLLVMIHGGPTTQYTSAYDARAQFFATRGFAVLGVNYRGSTGYGRQYMNALKGQWGILDVEDAMGGAQHLVDTGRANQDKLIIMGGSAGGYTVFQALTDFPGFFAAGISMYGITNLFSLTASTHKFESHYNDSLLGVLPKDAQLFRDRSPFFKAHKLTDPIAIFQGAKDVVVPKDQADVMVQKLKSRNVPHIYHVYENEGHGWRQAETIDHFYKTALNFLETYVVYT
jgi:dipeptidyl aminopeptidase/acylaminoacyl peptidase